MTQVFVCNLAILTLSQSVLILNNREEGLSEGKDPLELDMMKDGGHSILRMQEMSYFMTAPYQARGRHIISESWPVEDRAIRLIEEAYRNRRNATTEGHVERNHYKASRNS